MSGRQREVIWLHFSCRVEYELRFHTSTTSRRHSWNISKVDPSQRRWSLMLKMWAILWGRNQFTWQDFSYQQSSQLTSWPPSLSVWMVNRSPILMRISVEWETKFSSRLSLLAWSSKSHSSCRGWTSSSRLRKSNKFNCFQSIKEGSFEFSLKFL